MTIGIACAKGHSGRLPCKNLRGFAGKPLVEWTCIQMAAAFSVDRNIMVTESEQVAEIAERHGFSVAWEDAATQDRVGTLGGPSAALRGLEYAKGRLWVDEETVVLTTLPSQPLRMPDDIDGAVNLYRVKIKELGRPICVSTTTRLTGIGLSERREDGTMEVAYFHNQGRVEYNTGSLGVCNAVNSMAVCRHMVATARQDFHNVEYPEGLAQVGVPYPQRIWQMMDIDTAEQFEMVEALFIHYIGGEDAYKKYRGERC